MTEPLNREDVIGLLQNLGSEQDAEVLESARQLHAQVTGADLSWEDLLVYNEPASEAAPEPGPEPTPEPAEEPHEDEPDEIEAEAPAETPAEKAKKNAESLALLGKLLARTGISDDFRKELEDYKKDIAEGDFMEADHRYIRALHQRLSKRS